MRVPELIEALQRIDNDFPDMEVFYISGGVHYDVENVDRKNKIDGRVIIEIT